MTEQTRAKPRRNETIGGGVFVFRRGKSTGRIGVSHHRLPFEHATVYEGNKEAKRLSRANPGETYEVFVMVARIKDGESKTTRMG